MDQTSFKTSQPIPADVLCWRCGYDLRSQNADQLCPECGEPVCASIVHRENTLREVGPLLRFTDPLWLGKLRDGIVLILIGGAIVFLDRILGFSQTMNFLPLAFFASIPISGFVILCYGVWRLGSPEPGFTPIRRNRLWSAFLQYGALAYVVLPIIAIVLGAFRLSTWWRAIIGVLTAVLTFAGFERARMLFLRGQRPSFAWWSYIVGWALGASMLLSETASWLPIGGAWRRWLITPGQAFPLLGWVPASPVVAWELQFLGKGRPPSSMPCEVICTMLSYAGLYLLWRVFRCIGRARRE